MADNSHIAKCEKVFSTTKNFTTFPTFPLLALDLFVPDTPF